MAKELDPSRKLLTVERADNGWIVKPMSYRNDHEYVEGTFVARTPVDLAEILQTWAEKQDSAVTP